MRRTPQPWAIAARSDPVSRRRTSAAARSDLATATPAFAADDRFAGRAMAVVTTAVRPRFADLVVPGGR